jgi:predicted permease
VDPLRNGYAGREAIGLIRRIQDEILAAPGVQASAVARFRLLTGGSWNNPMTIQSDQQIATDREVHLNAVTHGFFETLGVRIAAGRDFEERDTLPADGGRRVAIVNEAFVQRYLGDRNPLGVRICVGVGPDAKPDTEIIGVTANISYRGVREDREQAYFPLNQSGDLGSAFYVRIQGRPEGVLQSIRAIVREADPALPIAYFRTLDEQVSRSLSTERMLAALSGGFGTLALLLSMVGLYGVMSFVVVTRTREIGVRLALGATRSSAVWLVLRDALTMTAAGIAIALPCAYALGRLIESQLYDVKPTDPWTIAAAVSVLGLTTLGAALIPARRASAVNPTEALRFE